MGIELFTLSCHEALQQNFLSDNLLWYVLSDNLVWQFLSCNLVQYFLEHSAIFTGEREDGGDVKCHLAAGIARRRQGVRSGNCADGGKHV